MSQVRNGRATAKPLKSPATEMVLPVPLSLKPMEAEAVDELPRGSGWLYEPKCDGLLRWRTDKAPQDCTIDQVR
jgi:ATP-dependent DNA ligase